MSDKSTRALKPLVDTKPQLLLVDDDPLISESLGLVLQEQFEVIIAESRKQTNTILQDLTVIPSLALVDLGLPPKPHSPEEGFLLLNDLLGMNKDIKILILSGQNEKMNIQHALTLGAVDFIPKPCDISLLKTRLSHQLMMLEAERTQYVTEIDQENLLGESSAMRTLRSLIELFADNPFPVLIEGESGSGKELVAENLHKKSKHKDASFLTINCAAFSPELLEAQLFGHIKGSYTGATTDKSGFFEDASEGSLFLDEIGELSFELQAKLLRVLENGEYYRLGETKARKSSARIIAATNRDLKESVRKGEFRQDLYHRLSVLTINVPPLNERDNDCFLLLDKFREIYSTKLQSFTLSDEAEQVLKNYTFPGNVRELRNIVIRLGAKYPGKTINASELEAELETLVINTGDISSQDFDSRIREELQGKSFHLDNVLLGLEQRYIKTALELSGGNLSKAARLLGVNRTTLYSRLDRLPKEEGS